MKTEAVLVCREVLAEAYREKLGLEFGQSVSDVGNGREPVWRVVSGDDLTTEQPENVGRSAGLLLDPEIGLLAYILPFHEDTALRKQISRALTLRSQLSIDRNYSVLPSEDRDDRGAWRIALHWLVDTGAKKRWADQIMEVRRETAFSEEVSMDAIFIAPGDTKTQIANYGFPRLLLTTREVLRQHQLADMAQWLSANTLVEQSLSTFASNFLKPEQNALAQDVVRAMHDFKKSPNLVSDNNQAPEKPQSFRSIRIRNFRNLRDVRFDFGQAPVSASIVHGPNGTGKSSLCEAISLALFRSSFRYKWFSDSSKEKDISATDRGREYVGKYLTPIEGADGDPKIALDDNEFVSPQLVEAKKADDADLAMNGTILTQDSSLEFARMPSHELGARVLRGYSELADHVDQFTESRVNQANTLRQEFLRNLGLSAAITKPDTAYERIAKREIDLELPPFPHVLVTWLEQAEQLRGYREIGLSQQWRAWAEAGRHELAREFAVSHDSEVSLLTHARRWLRRYNDLVSGSAEVIKNIEAKVEPIRNEFESAHAKVSTWGEWLERRTNISQQAASPEAELHAKNIQELQTLLNKVVEQGHSVAGHFDHLTAVEAFVRETWSKDHAADCPTCGTNHSEHGGILRVVESLRAKTASERDRLRREFTDLKARIDGVQKQLAQLGQAQCPLNTEEQSTLNEALQWLVPDGINLSEWIGVKTQRDALLAAVATLRQIPQSPVGTDIEGSAERVAKKALLRFREADLTFEAPQNWKPIKEKLTQILAAIVNEHLPHRLEKLWREIALNLTSAPWLLPDQFRIAVVTRRGEQASTIRVKDRLARYILNQAEIHTLGLAWFFTRHLTRGRFFKSCIVMDDPAHELDQTNFRELCRFLETLMRVHRVYDRPLKLIVMLNQESRAVEAARATGAILSILGWEREQDQSVRATSVIGEGFFAQQPVSMFAQTGT